MIPATGLSFQLGWLLCQSMPSWVSAAMWDLSVWGYGLLGLWAGLGFMLGELPNSFIKRQLDVEPGAAPPYGFRRYLFTVVDRVDSILGLLLFMHLLVGLNALTWLLVLLIGPLVHLGFSAILYRLKVKARLA